MASHQFIQKTNKKGLQEIEGLFYLWVYSDLQIKQIYQLFNDVFLIVEQG